MQKGCLYNPFAYYVTINGNIVYPFAYYVTINGNIVYPFAYYVTINGNIVYPFAYYVTINGNIVCKRVVQATNQGVGCLFVSALLKQTYTCTVESHVATTTHSVWLLQYTSGSLI